MGTQSRANGEDPDDLLLMTPDEFISAAANRGVRLRTIWSDRGRLILTDGKVRYTLPFLTRGLMPASLVWSALELFFGDEVASLLRFEFHLPIDPED